MRLLATIFLVCHGIAHLVGFRAAFWAPPGLPDRAGLLGGVLGVGYFGSRVLGVIWLLLALGYLASAALFLLRSPVWVSATLAVTGVSAAMCLLFWPEARIGLLVDVVLFMAVLVLSRGASEHLPLDAPPVANAARARTDGRR